MATREDVIAALKAKGYNGPIPGGQQPQQNPNDVTSMLNGVQPNMGQSLANAMSVLGGGKPIHEQTSDYSKLFATEAIKKQFEDPTVRQLREAEINALNQPPPNGFVRVGKQTLPDPNHINPNEQVEIDREKRQYEKDTAEKMAAEEANASKDNLIKMQSQDIYNTATEIEKGSQFFGPLGGDLPTWAAPSTWLPGGKTPGQRTNWEANLDKLRAGLSLDKINTLRSSGSTGSTGMGILSDRDISLLTDAATALRRNLDPKDAMKYIKDIKDVQAKFLGMQSQGGGNSELSAIEAELAQINAQLGQ